MTTQHRHARKKIFIDPTVQGAIVARILLHWTYAMLAGFLCLLMLHMFMDGVGTPFIEHLQNMWTRYGFLFIVMVCTFPAFAYDSIKLSHRFAGPVFSIRTALHKLGQGETIPQVRFRKSDFWKELADDINLHLGPVGEGGSRVEGRERGQRTRLRANTSSVGLPERNRRHA